MKARTTPWYVVQRLDRNRRLGSSLFALDLKSRLKTWSGVIPAYAHESSALPILYFTGLLHPCRDDVRRVIGGYLKKEYLHAFAHEAANKLCTDILRYLPWWLIDAEPADVTSEHLILWGRLIAAGGVFVPRGDEQQGFDAFELSKADRLRMLRHAAARVSRTTLSAEARLIFLGQVGGSDLRAEKNFERMIPQLLQGIDPEMWNGPAGAWINDDDTPHAHPVNFGKDSPMRVFAVAWQNGLPIPQAIRMEETYQWIEVADALNTKVIGFAEHIGAAVPEIIEWACSVAASGVRWGSKYVEIMAQYVTAPIIDVYHFAENEMLDVATQIALPTLMKDEVWERLLLARARRAPVRDYEFTKSEIGRRMLDDRLEHQRIQFAHTIAHFGGHLSVWEPLFSEWGIMERINTTDSTWKNAVESRVSTRSISALVEEFLAAGEQIDSVTAERFARAAESEDPALQPVFQALARRREAPEGAYRARLVARATLQHAQDLSMTVLLFAYATTNSIGIGRECRALRRLATKNQAKYMELLDRIRSVMTSGDDIAHRLYQASHPVNEVTYLCTPSCLKRLNREEAIEMRINGSAKLPPGGATLLHVRGRGGSTVKIRSLISVYATDVVVGAHREIETFTGREQYFRIPGIVRPLSDREAEMLKRKLQPIDERSEEELQRRTHFVEDIIAQANRVLPNDAFWIQINGEAGE